MNWCLFLIVLSSFTIYAWAGCSAPEAFELTSSGGHLHANGERFYLKGLSWFGFETTNNVCHGLWAQDYKTLLDFIKTNGFNAMRLPFYLELVLNNTTMPDSINYYNMNEDLKNLTSMQVLDKIIDYAGQNGILIMLDLHSFLGGTFMQDGLWYDATHPESMVIKGWDTLIARYANTWNVVALDLKNEPFATTWNTGDLKTDWDKAAARIGNHIHSTPAGSKYLIFVEGTNKSPPCTNACFWGENLLGVHEAPVELTQKDKLVYSPHCYGPSVAYQSYFAAPNFPANMPEIWDTHYGFVPNVTGNAIVIGEWGGQLTGSDGQWLDAYTTWLVETENTDNFFWCLNPDSGDTGGLLENDWKTPVTGKLKLVAKVNPNPTKVTQDSDGNICTFRN
mmetsp:Transcript_17870/g.19901  ORF Transcript_17870/g.19901 Transcript_17870/m.19901 type:complete len:393 (+) Transcript_17870:14-1192(+)